MGGHCSKCGRELTQDEIGASRKFINKGTTEFFCLDCLAERFRVTRELIEEKIEYLRQHGCTLFPKK